MRLKAFLSVANSLETTRSLSVKVAIPMRPVILVFGKASIVFAMNEDNFSTGIPNLDSSLAM